MRIPCISWCTALESCAAKRYGSLQTRACGKRLSVAPDSVVQIFGVDDLAALWVRHREGLDYLASTKNRRVETAPGDLVNDFRAALREQEAFIGSKPLWQLRVSYWYFTRIRSRHNKTLAQLGV